MAYSKTNKRYYWFAVFYAICFVLNANAQIPSGYYDDAVGKTGAILKSSLNGIISGHTTYPYTSSGTDVWDILKEADEDPNNSSNVIGVYSGFSMDAAAEYASGSGWSREHIWAKSRGDFGTSQGAGTDCHHIAAEDVSTNSARNNRNFDYGDSFYTDASGTYSGVTASKTSADWIWEPRDVKKGDVARALFYMATRYEGAGGEPDLELTETLLTNADMSPVHAKLSVLLEWHLADPVSSEEEARNEVIYSYQNNRNPFIDHPEYVCEIWTCAVSNNAPVFTSTAPTTVMVNTSYTYNITTNDTDANPLTILATTKPSWLSFTDNTDGTATLTGTPSSSDIGSHSVVLDVSDGTDNTEQSYTIVVSFSGTNIASDLLISEYIEGSSFNKGIEIANFTGAAVDLSDYSLFKQTNGAGSWVTELALSGTLNNNEVYVIVHSSAHADMQAEADLSTSASVMSFNGNDPIALFKSGVLLDVVGVFNDTGNFGKDLTLVRKSSVNIPSTSYTSSEWDNYSSDEFSYLGSHTLGSGSVPEFTSTAPTDVFVNGSYSYSITTNDADADPITISATTKPNWLSFTDNTDGTATLSGVPSPSDIGDHNVVLDVSDTFDNVEQSYTITVSAVSSSGTSDLFISEYIEGSSFNKGIEIANFTGSAVDLSDYSLFKQANGAGSWGSELALSGTLNNNDVYVVVHSSAHADMQAVADVSTASNAVTFNGNDPVGLFKSGVLIDQVGVFNSTDNFGKDVTLVRKSSINAGNTSYTTSEWDSYSSDEFSYLGSHTFDSNFLHLEMITPSAVSLTTGAEASGFVIGHLIDNSGLSGTATPANYASITSTENTADLWATTSPNGADPAEYFDNGVSDPVIEFTLAQMTIINSVIGWGYAAANSSGAAAGTIEFSDDGGSTYGKVYTFDIGATILDPANGGFEMLGSLNVVANYVRLTVTDNHKTLGSGTSGGDQVGFGELKFIGETFDISYSGTWSGGSGANNTPNMSDVNNNLIITSGAPTLTANASTRYVAIKNGASLSIDPNVTITAGEESIINGAAALVLKSDATGTGNFIDNGFVYDHSGTASVQKYIADLGLSLSSYHYISAPVDNHLKFTDMDDLYSYSEASLEWIHHSSFTNFTNVKGYAIRYESTTTKSFTGELNTGNLSVAVSTTTNGGSEFENKNLIGNPYPSSISADSLVDNNNTVLNTTLYFWNGSDYSTYNAALHSGTAGSIGETPDGNIAVGQAFFIDALTAGTVNVTNSMRGNDSNLFYKEKRFPQLRLFVESKNGRSEFLLAEHKSSTFGKDKYDSEHLPGEASLSMSVFQDGLPYDIQSIPELTNTTFDLQVEAINSQEVSFHLKEIVGLEGFQVYLEDRENNTITTISETEYTTFLSSGINNTRFKLRIAEEEKIFRAYVNNGQVEVFGLDGQPTKARLISIDGKIVASSSDMQFENWNNLANGIYLLEISLNKYTFTQKIIK